MASVVMPVVRLFFPCENAVLDYDDESDETKWVLTRPLHSAFLPAGAVGNFVQEEIWFYAQLTGGVGKFRLSVALSTEEGYWVTRSEPELLDFTKHDPLTVKEIALQMVNVLFPGPGIYEFKLLANHAELQGATAVFKVSLE